MEADRRSTTTHERGLGSTPVTIEEAVERLGFGRFQQPILLAAGLTRLSLNVPPVAFLAIVFLCTSLLSCIVSNSATIVVLYSVLREVNRGDRGGGGANASEHLARTNGIGLHRDSAFVVNVNLWLTPDSANLEPSRGGLVIFKKRDTDQDPLRGQDPEKLRWVAKRALAAAALAAAIVVTPPVFWPPQTGP